MKEREKKRAKKPDQAAAKGKPSGGASILGTVRRWQILCVKRRQPFSFGFGE